MEHCQHHLEQLWQHKIQGQKTVELQKELVKKYVDVFSGEVGCFEGKLHLEIDPQVSPVKLQYAGHQCI